MYVNISAGKGVTIFSGVSFSDFIECIPTPVENILLLKSGYLAPKNRRGFEVLEGKDNISELLREDIYSYGDFSFIDYKDADSIEQLKNEHVAELLYLAHTLEPLKSPYFEALQNKFVYLSHDDGWWCKIFCRDLQIPISIAVNKLQKSIRYALRKNEYFLPDDAIEAVQKLSAKGLLVSINLSGQKRNSCTMKFYEVGECENPDTLFNSPAHKNLPVSFEALLK